MIVFYVTICQFLALTLLLHLFFLFAIRKKRNDIADTFWGLGFVVLVIVALIHNLNLKVFVLFVLVSIWGIRLAANNYSKFKRSSEEDARYSKWRKNWGGSWRLWSWLKVFLLQGFFLILVAMPIFVIARYSSGEWNIVNTFGIFIWIFGFMFEIIGDKQLREFVKNRNREQGPQIMKTGLWKYSRHPNYFGEAVLWWGIWFLSFGLEYFYFAIIGPLTILILLRFVSGVPMAEERYVENLEFGEYKKKTPAMLPNFFVK